MTTIAQFHEVIKNFIKNNCTINQKDIDTLFCVINSYKNLSVENRALFRKKISKNNYPNILILSDYCAHLALNLQNTEFLNAALILHSIEDFNWDPRENILRLSIIWYISEKLKVDSNLMFTNASSISSIKAADFLISFVNRPKELKSLKAMGLIVKKERGSISIIQKLPPWLMK